MTLRTVQASVLALIVAAWPLAGSADTAGNANTMPRFSTIESEMPADSLQASSDPLWDQHITRQSRIAPLRYEIRAAIPVGTPQNIAMARLQQAGARCRPASEGHMDCGYHTVETRDEFVDDVHWNVDVGLRGGAVDQLAVQRSWSRH